MRTVTMQYSQVTTQVRNERIKSNQIPKLVKAVIAQQKAKGVNLVIVDWPGTTVTCADGTRAIVNKRGELMPIGVEDARPRERSTDDTAGGREAQEDLESSEADADSRGGAGVDGGSDEPEE